MRARCVHPTTPSAFRTNGWWDLGAFVLRLHWRYAEGARKLSARRQQARLSPSVRPERRQQRSKSKDEQQAQHSPVDSAARSASAFILRLHGVTLRTNGWWDLGPFILLLQRRYAEDARKLRARCQHASFSPSVRPERRQQLSKSKDEQPARIHPWISTPAARVRSSFDFTVLRSGRTVGGLGAFILRLHSHYALDERKLRAARATGFHARAHRGDTKQGSSGSRGPRRAACRCRRLPPRAPCRTTPRSRPTRTARAGSTCS